MMKLLKREYILWIILILFITALSLFSFFRKGTELRHSETKAQAYIININTASKKDLEMLEGIGSKTAIEIIRYREEHGPFKNSSELQEVPGIGQAVIDKIKDYVKV